MLNIALAECVNGSCSFSATLYGVLCVKERDEPMICGIDINIQVATVWEHEPVNIK